MHNLKLKKIKLAIAIFVAMAVLAMIGGILIFKNNYFLNQKFLLMQWDFIKTKLEYAKYSGEYKNLLTGKFGEKIYASDQNYTESVPVLLYHGIMRDPNWKPDGVNISLDDFKQQMFALKKAGYQSITLKDFYAFMQEEKKLPEKSIFITFDDGRSDSYYPADPIFRALDFNAVMFVITGRSFNSETIGAFHLSETELGEMLSSGRWEMGSHTQNGHGTGIIDEKGGQGNFLTNKMWNRKEGRLETDEEWKERIERDLLASKSDLEKKLGLNVIGFAYPFGDYGQESNNSQIPSATIQSEINNIFPLSFRQTDESEFPTNYPNKNFRLIKRIDVNSSLSAKKLISLLDESQKKTLPYSDSFSENHGWITGWGKSNLENGLLLTGASESEDSSLTFLNGTFLWTDYLMQAKVRIIKGTSFSVVVRYISENDYASCDFSNYGVSVNERIRGIEKTISESKVQPDINPEADISVEMTAKGNMISCGIGGRIIVSGIISQKLNHGGIGFKTWDNTVNNSSLLISNLAVK